MFNLFKKKPISFNNNKTIIQEYYSIKQTMQLPLKIKLFFDMLQNYAQGLTDKHKIPKQIADIYKFFCKSFQKLSLQEKYYFMLASIKIVKNIIEYNGKQQLQILQFSSQVQNIQTSCQIKQQFLGLSRWEQKIFKFLNDQKILKIYSSHQKNKQVIIQLQNYHIRGSNKQKNTLVLQAIFQQSKIQEKYQHFYIYFKQKALFNQIYVNLKNAIIMSWRNRFIAMLNIPEKNEIKNPQNKQNNQQQSTLAPKILNSKTISEYFKTKQKIQNKVNNKKLKFKTFSQVRKIKILRASKYQNLYKVQNLIDLNYEEALQNIELISRVPTKKLTHYEKMQHYSKTITAVYYKYVVKGCTHDMLSIVQQNFRENQLKVTFKAIQNYTLEKNVDFLQIKVQKNSINKTKISVFGFINFDQNKKMNPISVMDFLLSIVQYQANEFYSGSATKSTPIKQNITYQAPSCKVYNSNTYAQNQLQNQDQDQFKTVNGQNFSDEQDPQLQICNTFPSPNIKQMENNQNQEDQQTKQQRNVINQFKNNKSFYSQKIYNQFDQDIKSSNHQKKLGDYLKRKFIIQPQTPTKSKDLLKRHYFQGQWSKYQKGGVFSLNTVLIDKQKQIFKSFLSRMGNALMKKSFSNLSLPVVVFKPESQLQSIARNFSYAPLFFEKIKTMSALQRMKSSILTMISMGTIGLSLQKPFNPIIGQTFQAYIDNCPIYMEQTQHHPSTSTIYFVGRGYKIFGSVIPSISIRLNSVKCFSQSPITIKFDNQDEIQFTPGKMLIGGFLVGDRTFDYTDTSYLIDKKNKLFAQINFGSKKKFTKNMKGEKNDFVWGHIYQVTQNFIYEFQNSNRKKISFVDKSSKILSQVYGCWHEKIFFDQRQFFDFEKQLPYRLVREKTPLKSDCSRRLDIKYLQLENLQKAQDQKDKAEQIQRNDTKLRKKTKNQSN